MRSKTLFYMLLSISLLALILSFFAERVLHLTPCFLCRVQRAIYFLLIFPAVLGLLKKRYAKGFSVLFLAIGLLVASYHTMVQLEIFEDRCHMSSTTVRGIEDYRNRLLQKSSSCSKQVWMIGKISAPAVNAGLSLLLLFGSIAPERKNDQHLSHVPRNTD